MKSASPLVSCAWLEAHLDDPQVRVLDVRGQVLPAGSPSPRYRALRHEYVAGHVPGARFVDWLVDIVDLDDPIPTQLAPPEKLEACMARLGVGAHSVVVAYDSYSHMFAGRLRWALRAYGFDNVFVLEGGWGTWCREGRPVETGEPVDGGEDERNPPALHDIPPFRARAVSALRATKDDVVNVVRGSRSALLVDARSPAQYRGETSAAARAGHIPGAINVPYAELLEASDGRYLPEADLLKKLHAAGVPEARDADIIVYCNGGISATVPLTALERLGYRKVSLYDGSWNEWGNDASLPIQAADR